MCDALMKYPQFYNDISPITLYDPLADFLGSITKGITEFRYIDIVKSSGHSCPTVAGAYIITYVGLNTLYKDKLPVRGEIEVLFKDKKENGVNGVIANIISQITGASDISGFKGINQQFKRCMLMHFDQNIKGDIKFIRTDTNQTIELRYDPSLFFAKYNINPLMQKVLKAEACDNEKREFRKLWQKGVEDIFNNIDKVIQVIP